MACQFFKNEIIYNFMFVSKKKKNCNFETSYGATTILLKKNNPQPRKTKG